MQYAVHKSWASLYVYPVNISLLFSDSRPKPASFRTGPSDCGNAKDSIMAIKVGIANDDFPSSAEAWFELSNEVKTALWKAPTKGGCFTKIEREIIKSSDFRKLHYNEGESE